MSAVYKPGRCMASLDQSIDAAQERADANDAPVLVIGRDGWYAICEEPPDDLDPSPYTDGWIDVSLVEPQRWTENE